MSKTCHNCKCHSCGNLHSCEIIMDKAIHNDMHNIGKCVPIYECNHYTSHRNYDLNKIWNCYRQYGPKK